MIKCYIGFTRSYSLITVLERAFWKEQKYFDCLKAQHLLLFYLTRILI